MLVPKRITFYCREKDTEGVQEAFPVDTDAKSHVTERDWSSYGDYGKGTGESYEYENKAFDNVTIIGLVHRGNGGRAYKAVVEVEGRKFKIDLREDTLMDVMMYKGIQAGGKLNGTFCFTKQASQTDIILEGTEKHKQAIENQRRRDTITTNIKKSDLKVGHIYETLAGDTAVFIGHIYTADVNEVTGILGKPYKAMLWIAKSKYSTDGYEDSHRVLNDPEVEMDILDRQVRYLEIKKSHSFKLDGGVEIEGIKPDVYLDNIKRYGRYKLDRAKKENQNRGYSYSRDYRRNIMVEYYRESKVEYDRKLHDMRQEDINEIYAM